jgi:urease accessory protein
MQEVATAELAVAVVRGRSAVCRARPAGPLRLLAPASDTTAAWVYQSSLGGGFVARDALALEVRVDAGATLFLSSQAAGKVYRGATASFALDASVGEGASLVAWPDPAMCFAGAAFAQRQQFALAHDANLIAVDAWSAGRIACGERWAFESVSTRVAVDVAGTRVVDDAVVLAAAHGDLAARLPGVGALATAVVVGPRLTVACDELVTRVAAVPISRARDRTIIAASRWPWGVVVRAAAPTTAALVMSLRELLAPCTSLLLDRDPWIRKW